MRKGMKIERVTARNFDEFAFLITKLAEYEKLDPPRKDALLRLKKDALAKKPRYFAYIATIDKKPIGYTMFYFTYSSFLGLPTLFIEDIFVLKEYRRVGFGQAIWDFIVQYAMKKGCGRVEFIVLNWNKPAQRFYQKNDAQKLNWQFYRLPLKTK